MLIITRRPGDALRIGDEVIVHVLGVRALQVRVGIDAPRTVRVVRSELAMRYVDPPIITPSAAALDAMATMRPFFPSLPDILRAKAIPDEPMWRCDGCLEVGQGATAKKAIAAIGHLSGCTQTFSLQRVKL